MDWKLLTGIFCTFVKIGSAAFGGGYAMIPVIEREVVSRKNWISEQEMCDVLTVSGSAPGGIGVNAAAFIGYRLAGIPGATAAVTGITLPAFLVILIWSMLLGWFGHQPAVEAAFKGIHAAVTGLIVVAAYRMGKSAIQDRTALIITAVTVILLLNDHMHPMLLIVFGLFIGIILVKVKERLGLKGSLKTPGESKTDTGYSYTDYYIGDGI
jgi:chromate transporter